MDEQKQEPFRREAERQIALRPESRVFSFMWEGQKYWIKRKRGNHRRQLIKDSVEKEFYYELAHITMAARSADCAPDMALLTDTYFALRDGGRNLTSVLRSELSEEEKRRVMRKAGGALASLHAAGLFHGRPALRDITWDGKKITLIDWESKTYFRSLLRRQMTDILIFIQGMYRESWMKEDYVRAAWEGYLANGGGSAADEAKRFLKRHGVVYAVCRALHPFHFKDVESMEKACRWILREETR